MAESYRRQAIIALGSNLGDRGENLSQARQILIAAPGVVSLTPSPIYETAPVGVEDQPVFLNMVAGVETVLSPENLMILLLETEQQLGRIRSTRWGPRLIDLDLLFFEKEARDSPGLSLPHPRWRERTFVTLPLRDLLALPPFDSPAWSYLQKQLQDIPPDPGVRRIED